MTMDKALVLLFEYYQKAKSMDHIKNPIAWAFYQTWKEVDGWTK